MRLILFVGLALVASASAVDEGETAVPVLGYHDAFGFAAARRIKASEDAILARQRKGGFRHEDMSAKIVGGSIAPTDAHPYLAGLIINLWNVNYGSVCGSSLLSPNRLVTAAHCWFDGTKWARQFVVVLGSRLLYSGGIRIATSQVVMHPLWTPSVLANDVAMIYLPTSVRFSHTIQPIALPSGTQLGSDFAGQWAVAAGYGVTSDRQTAVSASAYISQVRLQVITVAQCQYELGFWAQPSNICTNGAGGGGICGGDSGGPLVVNQNGRNILVGISSFVAQEGCQRRFPSAFTRVTSFYDFILEHMF